jgi:MFS family permease
MLRAVSAQRSAAFGFNAVSYIPLIIALLMWKRPPNTSVHPRERVDRAIISGARFVWHSPPVRTVVLRSFTAGAAGASISALMPLIARDMLHGDASTYGVILGAFGVGAVIGGLTLGRVLERWTTEWILRAGTLSTGVLLLAISVMHNLFLICGLLVATGVTWMLTISTLNVGIQLSTPSWVTARALAWFQSALTGGVGLGAWLWGHAAGVWNLEIALALSGAAVLATAGLGLLMPMPETNAADIEAVTGAVPSDPEIALPLTPRSGPISLEIDYQVTAEQAPEFLMVMQDVQSSRLRQGAFDWTLERDIGNPALWTERYYFPTWGDYLRQRTRFTEGDHQVYRRSLAFRSGTEADVRRRLERPPGATGRARGPIGIFTP